MATTQVGSARARQPRKAWSQRLLSDKAVVAYVFVLPYVVLFFVFRIVPAISGVLLSFTNYSISGDIDIVGLDHFRRLFADPVFWNALRVTAVYTAIAVPATVAASLAMSLLCSRPLRGIKIYRALYFLPVVTSFVLVGVVWQWLLSQEGAINWLLGLFGADAVPFLQSQELVLPSIAVTNVWARFGYDMLILLAGLLAIPSEYYEAAEVDGAGIWHRFRHVTLPLLRPALFFVVVIELIVSFQVFDVIFVMTGGGPVRGSYSLIYMLYDQGFRAFDFGYASAIGVVLFAITLVVSLTQRYLIGRSQT